MTAPSGSGDSGYVVGTWTFTDPYVPLDTACYELRLDGAATIRKISAAAVAVYYGAVEPGGRSILLLHNDIHRSAMSRHRFAADGSLAEEGGWSSGGQGGSYIAFDPSGRYFVVANAHMGWAVFRNGTEPELIASLHNEGSGPHPRQRRSQPHRPSRHEPGRTPPLRLQPRPRLPDGLRRQRGRPGHPAPVDPKRGQVAVVLRLHGR